jgi:hypothetical protein
MLRDTQKPGVLSFHPHQPRYHSRLHALPSCTKSALQEVTVQVPQVVEPAAQDWVPVPSAIAQGCEPAGLLQLVDVEAAPHTEELVGVQA